MPASNVIHLLLRARRLDRRAARYLVRGMASRAAWLMVAAEMMREKAYG